MKRDWSKAVEISDRITDLMNQRLAEGVDPISLYAGQLLGLIGFMRSSPQLLRPKSFNKVGQAAEACLQELSRQEEADHKCAL